MGGRREGNGSEPTFDVVLWGYDRDQVDRCLDQLTAQLAEAGNLVDTVDVLQAQLAQAHAEIGELRLTATAPPGFAERLSGIMQAAEQLRLGAAEAWNAEHPGQPVEVTLPTTLPTE